MDERIDRIGFRRAEFKKDGFYLNGKKIKLRGLNRHQSYPYVGYAMPKSMQQLDADILKRELGVNAVRTSHYPQSHYFIERCDEIGLLVFTEIPGWQHIGDAAWKDQAVENVRDMVKQYLIRHTDKLFDAACVDAFFHIFSDNEFAAFRDDSFETKLWEIVPREKQTFDWETCKNIADFFAQIVDYKSSFTSRHSIGVAEKAAAFAAYTGYDSTQVQKMYLAGALHDIGNMAIDNDILEKPDKLTDEEFSKMKNHAGYTYLILSNINDFEDIRDWAAFRHEKLNGKGYPFGKTAAELNEPERIMACIDIYQALTESRPYKQGFSHEKTCDILDDMADKGFIDAGIAQKIRVCFQNTTI